MHLFIRLCNSLGSNIKSVTSLHIFRRKLKNLLLSQLDVRGMTGCCNLFCQLNVSFAYLLLFMYNFN